MNISGTKRDNSNYKKDYNTLLDQEYKYVLQWGIRPQFHGEMGVKMGINFSGTSKTLFLT